MSYDYKTQRAFVFTEAGVNMVMQMRDHARRSFETAGAVRMDALMHAGGCGGDSWDMMACADYLVEKNYMREVSPPNCVGQHRVFVEIS